MKLFDDGTLQISAAEDGGFVSTKDTVEGRYTTYLNGGEARTFFESASEILSGMSMYGPNAAGVSLDQPPGTGIAAMSIPAKQKAIHAEIAKLRGASGNNMTFANAWQRLQSTRPELFSGLEPTIVHQD
jgi:hypothetical protein